MALSAVPISVSADPKHADREVVVKVPMCIDFLAEGIREDEIPGCEPKKVAWANLNLETGETTFCEDDDPIYQHKVVNEWWS